MAKNSSIGGIFAELTLRDGKFTKGLSNSGAKLKQFGTSAAKYGAMAATALGAGLAVGANRAIDMGGSLTDLSAQTGVAIGDLMRIQQAYKDNGKAADGAGKDINKMQKSISEAAYGDVENDPFAKLGLSAEKLMAMNPTQQFYSIAEAIKRIQNPTEKTARAMEIFGRSGGELLAVFEGSDLDSVNRSLGDMPKIMQEFSAELDHAGDLLGRLPNKTDQFFTGFTAGVVGHLIPALENIDTLDFTNLGRRIGESISFGMETALNEYANLVTSTMDWMNGESWKDSVNRYADANAHIIDEREREAAERKKNAADKAAYEAARLEVYRTSPDYVDPETIKPAKIKSTKSFDPSDPEFDSYRSRGLSLSASPTAETGRKQLDVQLKIFRLLEGLKGEQGELKWT